MEAFCLHVVGGTESLGRVNWVSLLNHCRYYNKVINCGILSPFPFYTRRRTQTIGSSISFEHADYVHGGFWAEWLGSLSGTHRYAAEVINHKHQDQSSSLETRADGTIKCFCSHDHALNSMQSHMCLTANMCITQLQISPPGAATCSAFWVMHASRLRAQAFECVRRHVNYSKWLWNPQWRSIKEFLLLVSWQMLTGMETAYMNHSRYSLCVCVRLCTCVYVRVCVCVCASVSVSKSLLKGNLGGWKKGLERKKTALLLR